VSRQTRVAATTAIVTLVMVAALAVVAIVRLPSDLSTSRNAEEVRRANEIASCRSQWRSRVDDAVGRVLAAKSELDVLTNEGLQASVTGDDARLETLTGQAPAERDSVLAAVAELTKATDDYRAAVDRSVADPAGFLADCRNQRP